MNDIYLSHDQNEMIDRFYKGPLREPLILYGPIGSGKSTLALQILQKTHIIKIDSSLIRNNTEIEKLIESLSKQSITLMFKNHKKRSLLIDDIAIYYKDDKRNYNYFMRILPSLSKKIACILIADPYLMRNRKFSKISELRLSLHREYYLYYRLATSILDKNKISRDKYDDIIYKSGGNLHHLIRNIESRDIFYDLEKATRKILKDRMKPNDLIYCCQGNDVALSLNLLDNIQKLVPISRHKEIPKLYKYAMDADAIETHATKNHLWEMLDYSLILGIYPYQKYRSPSPPKINYNCYLSKGIAQIASQKTMAQDHSLICNVLCQYLQKEREISKDDTLLTNLNASTVTKYLSLIGKYYDIKNSELSKSLMILL